MKANNSIIPFFNKTPDLVVGLNQLGMRNQAEALFTQLLPGFNNVSDRIRYYSFYCWIIQEFYRKRKEAVESDFNKYIRSSEYLLALIHTKEEESTTIGNALGIPGITFALSKRIKGQNEYSLDEGITNVNGKTEGTYWKNPGGVLRQYYSSSLKDIAILGENLNNPSLLNISKKGDFVLGSELANSFRTSIGERGIKFLEILERRTVTSKELDELLEVFNMRNFKSDEEKQLIINLLLQKDYPNSESLNNTYRRTTIKFYMQYLNNSQINTTNDIGFAEYMYKKFLNENSVDSCVLGWYRYFLNEEWQYNSSEIFCLLLDLLSKDGKWYDIHSTSKIVAEAILNHLHISTRITIEKLCSKINKISNPDGEKTIINAAHGFIGLLTRYIENRNIREKSKEYTTLFSAGDLDDYFTLMDNLDEYKNNTAFDWLQKFIIRDIIHRHHEVSQKKYFQTGIASQKFIYENGYLRFLRNTEATHTSPRIKTLNSFLKDLGLIVNDKLSEEGISLLNVFDHDN